MSEAALLALAESIADGSAIDWTDAERRSRSDHRAIVRQLKVIAELATLHRTMPADPSALPTAFAARRLSATPAVGRWAHLDLIERLGGGTFGEVFRAFDRHLERDVALKLLRSDAAPEDDFQSSRILAEGRRLARLHHPNVVTVYGAAMHDGRVGLWMELVKGSTLEQVVQKNGPMSATEAAAIGIDLCRALAALHQAGLIHRDIKTQNVMRAEGGRIVLMDLGTGRLLGSATDRAAPDLAGTPLYLAPELFGGAAASPCTDLYSLGVLLYRLATNAFPIEATTIDELHAAHAGRHVVRLRDRRSDLPSAFVQVVERAMSPEPALRYGSAGELEADLLKALPASDARRRGRRANAGIVTAAALVAATAAGALVYPSAPRWSPKPVSAIHSIAVLPLANLSGDPAQDYFVDGMTEELIATLGRVGAKVISRTSAMQFKASAKPLPEIARALHVDAVLEGSVRMAGGSGPAPASGRRVRIDARLIYAGTDTQLWDKTFEAVVGDVLLLQRQVATAVADGINLQMTSNQHQTLMTRPTTHTPTQVDAFDLYLKGRFEWNRRTDEGLKRSIQYFEAAIDRDPGSALPYAGLADAYNLLGDHSLLARGQALSQSEAAAEKAVALDDTLSEAHASLAYVRLNQFNWRAAEAEFKRALALNPGYATAHQWYAFYLAQQTRFDEAIAEASAALALDPLSVAVNAEMGFVLMHARRYDAAIAQFEKTLAVEPNYRRALVHLAQLYLFKGDRARAISVADRVIASGARDIDVLADVGYTYGRAGKRGEAEAILRELVLRHRQHEEGAAIAAATVLVGLGDAEGTLFWLNRANEVHDSFIGDLKMDARFDAVRSDRRFRNLLASVGLAL